jgi:hypothetical protein
MESEQQSRAAEERVHGGELEMRSLSVECIL